MCGIAGIIDFSSYQQELKEQALKMQECLKQRGPDQQDIYQDGVYTLIHARLAVVDLENGKQPMIAHDQGSEVVLVYNGELYNTEELRKNLIKLGFSFKGHSDSEVLLKAYLAYGIECVASFNGIFAFTIYDQRKKIFFMARDRMGVKPFFYVHRNNFFAFASEIKSLLAHPKIEPILDQNGINEIFLMGPGRTLGQGVFKGILELPPAHYAIYQDQKLSVHAYWKLEAHEHHDDFKTTNAKVNQLVQDAIERQLVADVPIATFLSGGLDSSIISALAAKSLGRSGRRLQTFSVDYEHNDQHFKSSKFQPDSDDYYIDLMSKAIQSDHKKIILKNEDVAQSLNYAVEARDLPGMSDVDSSLYLFCKQVKKEVTVVLSGECADEIFGGYPWYRDDSIRNINGFPWAQSLQYRMDFMQSNWLNQDSLKYVEKRYEGTIKTTSILDNDNDLETRMKQMMHLNLDWFMQTLLDRKDRMSMASGLEVRVPFCDYRIVEYLYSVPWAMKDYKQREKGLLREAMKDLLPQEVLWRKKSPYPKTHHPKYRKIVSDMLQNILNDPTSPLLTFVKKEMLVKLIQEENAIPWYGQLMTTAQTIAYFIQINYWLKHYRVILDTN